MTETTPTSMPSIERPGGQPNRSDQTGRTGSADRAARLFGGRSAGQFYAEHWFAAAFPAVAGIGLFGWRAVVVIITLLAGVGGGSWIWRRIGWRGDRLRPGHLLWLGMLLAMLLPAHLASSLPSEIGGQPLWLILPSAGLILVIFCWLLDGVGSGRVHPLLPAFLFLCICFPRDLTPHYVLNRADLFRGDVTHIANPDRHQPTGENQQPWWRLPPTRPAAFWREPASQQLIFYTLGLDKEGGWQSISSFLRDRMPPMEDFVIGGQPAPIGSASVLAVIIGGLFLIYRGLIDWRIPLFTILTAYVVMLLAPIPVMITDQGVMRYWLCALQPGVGWAVALTFVNYQILAGSLIFTAFFIAPAPTLQPYTGRGCLLYGLLVGVIAGFCQLYVSVLFAAPLAVLVAGMAIPTIDRWTSRRQPIARELPVLAQQPSIGTSPVD